MIDCHAPNIYISCGFFANFMNESTNIQAPRSLTLTPPPHSSHDYLPNLTLSRVRWNGPGQLEP